MIILLGIILIVVAIGLAMVEIMTAKAFCVNEGKKFSMKILPTTFYCSGEEISLYTDGWDYKRPDLNNLEINWSENGR